MALSSCCCWARASTSPCCSKAFSSASWGRGSTILGWSYYGERAIEYLLGVRVITPYRVVLVVAAFLGSFALEFGATERAGFAAVWAFSDVMNGAMAIPNLVGLLVLSRVVASETKSYLAGRPPAATAASK